MKLVIAFIVMACCLAAQTAVPYPLAGQTWEQPMGIVPTSSTSVATTDVLISAMHLANISTTVTATVTLVDGTTNCASAACQWWPVVTIAPNTVYDVSLNGLHVVGGVKWQASGATIVGWIKGTYTVSAVAKSDMVTKEQAALIARTFPK